MTIDELDLHPVARDAAYLLQARCPWVVFTSGRRDWYAQAHAMARNVITARQQGNWNWLEQVYGTHEPQLQAWVNDHQEETNVYAVAEGLFRTMQGLDPAIQARFAHPAGRAFDVQPPVIPEHDDLLQHTIKTLPKLELFLSNEGGLPIYHTQFVVPVEV